MTAPRSCASCDETGCALHRPAAGYEPVEGRTAWLLDDVWPETASMVAATVAPGDQVIAPGLWGRRPARYRWPVATGHAAPLQTLRRHIAMRRVAGASGGVRQRTCLMQDRALARALAPAIDYRVRHLVVAQAWLPWLDEAGVLGGRSFDVVMSRYPMHAIHAMLDAAAVAIGASATISDYRADAALLAREAGLLARARRIVTPHHGIAALHPESALRLAWHRPTPPRGRRPGTRTAFLGPTIARTRPDVARRLAADLREPLIVFGSMLEPALWGGIAVEHRPFGPAWLDGIGVVLHPAAFTAQPRRLLEAVASGVRVLATAGAGLDPNDYCAIAPVRSLNDTDFTSKVLVPLPEDCSVSGVSCDAPPRLA